jgi:Haemolysin secretion/activation protein ShlB/FhaC/HecB
MPACRILLLAGLGAAVPSAAAPLSAQTPASTVAWPADAFADDGARALVLHALTLRDSAAAGLASYEATATERTHVGLSVTRRLPLRARTLYHREQVARVYWERGGAHVVRWLGRREGRPATGAADANDAVFGDDLDLAGELGLDDIGVDLLFDPRGDRLDVFEAEFVQPVSATGLRLYRFASGDTMQIRLPAPDRTITLVEVIVRPRETAWEAVEGSLWFDRDTGVLVRAAFRPSGVWDWAVREPGDLDDVPGFLEPGIGIVRSIVLEYALFDQRWWLPRRVAADAVVDFGSGLVRMPIAIEWTMTGHVVNEAPGAEVSAGPGLVTVGRSTFGNDVRRERTVYLAPAGIDLSSTAALPPPLVEGEALGFSPRELGPLVARISEVAGPAPAPPPPSLRTALLTSLRYDRVRGASVGYGRTLEAGPIVVTPHVRLASAIPDVHARLDLAWRGATAAVYRTLFDASDWNVADGLGNSAATLLFGHDGGDYVRVAGGALGARTDGVRLRAHVETFAEWHRAIERQTNISLATVGGGSLRPNIDAAALDLVGVRAAAAGQRGSDVRAGVLNWGMRVEAATGDARYGRVAADVRVTGPVVARFEGAVALAAGVASEGAPPQRAFLLGGVGTVRGVRENAIAGRSFWLVRGEVARGLPMLRAVAFADLGWAGVPEAWRDARPAAGVGFGASMLDGLFRLDVARGVARAGVWRIYFQLDAAL